MRDKYFKHLCHRSIDTQKLCDQEDRPICELSVSEQRIYNGENKLNTLWIDAFYSIMSDFEDTGLESNEPSMWCICPLQSCRRITDLWRLVGNEDTLAAGDGVVHVLTEVIPLHSDQVAGRGCLTCANGDGTMVGTYTVNY